MKHIPVYFEKSFLPKKIASSTTNTRPSANNKPHRTLTLEDEKALQYIKHYENFLWLKFQKVFSVGASVEDDTHLLPAFVKILGNAGKERGQQ